MIEIWTLPIANPLKMGKRKLVDLPEAARKAAQANAYIVGYVSFQNTCGYRVYATLINHWGKSGPINDCAPGWSVQLLGRYRNGRWIALRSTQHQALLEVDPSTLKDSPGG